MKENILPTALVVMDMQLGILAMVEETQTIIRNVAKAIDTARKNAIPVIYVVVGFRKGIPEVSADSAKSFAAGKAHFSTLNMDEFMAIPPQLTPLEDEVTIVKRRVSAFSGSDFELVLRSLGIRHLVLTGIATGGVVLSTVREAADKDYKLTVLADGCMDRDEEVHQLLTTKILPTQAEVIMVDEWIF